MNGMAFGRKPQTELVKDASSREGGVLGGTGRIQSEPMFHDRLLLAAWVGFYMIILFAFNLLKRFETRPETASVGKGSGTAGRAGGA